MATKTIKVTFGGDTRRMRISSASEDERLSEFRALLKTIFGERLPESYRLTYVDDEGDEITIVNASDLEEAFDVAKGMGKTLKIQLENLKPIATDDMEPSAPSVPSDWVDVDTEAKKKPSIFEKKEGKKQFKLAKKAGKLAEKLAKKAEKAAEKAAKFAKKAEKKAEKAARKAFQGKKVKDTEGSSDDEEARPRWRGRWRRGCHQKRKECKESFRKHLKELFGDEKIVKALQDALPKVIDKLLNNEDLKSTINSVVEAHEELKNNDIIKRVLPYINGFLGMMPKDIFSATMVDFLLEIQKMLEDDKFPKDRPFKFLKHVMRSLKRSCRRNAPEIHHGICCDKCNMAPLMGPRWKKSGENYDLCQKDYDSLSDEEKKDFERIDVHSWRPPFPGFPGGPGFGFMMRGPHHDPFHGPHHGPHGHGPPGHQRHGHRHHRGYGWRR